MPTETQRTGRKEAPPEWGGRVQGGAWGNRLLSALPLTESTAPSAVLGRDASYRRLLALADMLSAAIAIPLAIWIAPAVRLSPETLLALPAIVLMAKILGLYDRDDLLLRKTTLEETPQLFQLATLFSLGTWLTAPTLFAGPLNRSGVVELLGILLFLLILGRTLARRLARRLSEPERCLFIGDDSAAARFTAKLESDKGTKARVVAHVGLEDSSSWTALDLASDQMGTVRELIDRHDVHRVVLAPSTTGDPAETIELVRVLKAVGVNVSLLPHLFEAIGSSVVFDDIEGMTLLGVRRLELTRSSYLLKRGTDLLGAAFGLLLTLPLSLLIAVLVKLDSRGPVLFRQERIGRGGDPFRMVKFRTMDRNAEANKSQLAHRNEGAPGFFKITDDPRVTRLGRWLRATSLDELPQLLNVLRGEMSLVGPRPLIHEEDRQILGWQRRRLDLTPGMTGHWQILGSSRVPINEMVAIDYLYVANWSLWNDVKILLRTAPYVLGRHSR